MISMLTATAITATREELPTATAVAIIFMIVKIVDGHYYGGNGNLRGDHHNNNSQYLQQSHHQSLHTYPQHQLPSEHPEGEQLDTTWILAKISSTVSSSRSAGSCSGSGSQQTLEDKYLWPSWKRTMVTTKTFHRGRINLEGNIPIVENGSCHQNIIRIRRNRWGIRVRPLDIRRQNIVHQRQFLLLLAEPRGRKNPPFPPLKTICTNPLTKSTKINDEDNTEHNARGNATNKSSKLKMGEHHAE